jgi:hypothetical protein
MAAQQRNFEAYVKAMEGCVKKVNGAGEGERGGDGGGKGGKEEKGGEGKRVDKDGCIRRRSNPGDALCLISYNDEPGDAAHSRRTSSSLSTSKESLEPKSSKIVSTDLGDAAVLDLFHRSLEQISVAKTNHKKTKRHHSLP